MKILYSVYTILTSGLALFSLFPFWLFTRISGKYKKSLKERLGYISQDLTLGLSKSPRIWIHAVSLGEVRVAASMITALRRLSPDSSMILSTTTEHGRDLAKDIIEDRVPVIYGPIDFILSVRKALYTIRPDVLVFLETEIWPAWIVEGHKLGIKIALINGRISPRSFNYYLRFRSFFRVILDCVDTFSMIAEEDRLRILSIGAHPGKVSVNGNAKYDLLFELADPTIENDIRKVFDLDSSRPVFIAGSIRNGERLMIINTYKKILKEFPDTVLLIAPRHIKNSGEIASLLDKNKLGYQIKSEMDKRMQKRSAQVVIINTFGELFKIYSVGTIIFCGGSLIPLGGQNPLEAAVWGKVVLYGPHMDHFLDAKALLEKNDAGFPISSPEALAEKTIYLLKNPDLIKQVGARARQAVKENRKSAEKHARIIVKLMNKSAHIHTKPA